METIAAIDRLIATGLKRNFRYAAALAAGGLEHFTLASTATATATAATVTATAGTATVPTARSTLRFARLTAIGAAVGFVLEPFGSEKFLLAGRKCKFVIAINARQLFISIQTRLLRSLGVVRLATY